MSSEFLQKTGVPLVWANGSDYSNANSGYARTHQLDLTSLANNAARQGAKADLGESRARQFAVIAGMQPNATPAANVSVELWWSASPSATAGIGNMGGTSGSDGAYKAGFEEEWKQQLEYLGALLLTNNGGTTVQYQCVGRLAPLERYGMPVVVNKSGVALKNNGVEMFVALVPLVDEIED